MGRRKRVAGTPSHQHAAIYDNGEVTSTISGTPKLVIFDLDGTLIDSRLDLVHSVNAALRHIARPELPDDVIASYVGDGAPILIQRALGCGEIETHDTGTEMVDDLRSLTLPGRISGLPVLTAALVPPLARPPSWMPPWMVTLSPWAPTCAPGWAILVVPPWAVPLGS